MKDAIHPKWYPDAKITCACGTEYTVGSTVEKATVELCSHCHPVYTGVEKIVDIEGRVEKFAKKRAAAEAASKNTKPKKVEAKGDNTPKTLREMLAESKKA